MKESIVLEGRAYHSIKKVQQDFGLDHKDTHKVDPETGNYPCQYGSAIGHITIAVLSKAEFCQRPIYKLN